MQMTKCDRCGKIYHQYHNGSGIVSRRIYDDTNITGPTLDLKMDLCQECMQRCQDFINNKDEI